MKGIIFTEFMEMVEAKWGLDTVNQLVETVQPASQGAYTTVGTYEFSELEAYLIQLIGVSGLSLETLLRAFGNHLAGTFVTKFPDFFSDAHCTFDVLKKVDDHIHVEVLKLYPDANLPKFDYEQRSDKQLLMKYQSSRNLADLGQGIIEGCAQHFNETMTISRESKNDGDMYREDFLLTIE